MTKIKICGLKRAEDIDIVNRYLPDFCGFVINFPKSARSISPERVRELVKGLDRGHIKAVGVFVDEDPEIIASLLEDGTIDMAQLHGKESEDYIKSLKKRTASPVIKAFVVNGEESLKEAEKSCADYILLDRGQGSGKVFDWSLLDGNFSVSIEERGKIPKSAPQSACGRTGLPGQGTAREPAQELMKGTAREPAQELMKDAAREPAPEKFSRKWFLAGGLNASNISRAIQTLSPYAVDLSGSVETDGVKDPAKVEEIIGIVRSVG